MSRIEDQANYYKNLHLHDRRIQAVIHIENKDDENFWNVQLQAIKPGFYRFISQSRNESGVDSKGCEQCLKYRPYINRRFFICIDSDLRLLREEEGLSAENYIAQTYAYSWESHSCESKHLEHRFSDCDADCDFSYVSFLEELSRIVYKPLLYLVYHNSSKLNKLWNIRKFNNCLPNQLKREELENNGRQYLQKISHLFDDALSSLNLPEEYSLKDVTPENAYLHIQGHRLYDIILNIGTLLCRAKRIAFKSEILDKEFPVSGYREIDNVQNDLHIILLGKLTK